jgi:pimeloyl-ACP methyl ester carboxylesterase
MSVIPLQEEVVHYEVLGRGRPIIFLHGWVGSWRYWVPSMQSASISYRAYALDLWGFGHTAWKPSSYSLEQQTELLGGFLETLGIGRVAVVGHGLGAVAALGYAQKFPESVDRLMLTSLPFGVSNLNALLSTASVAELVEWLFPKQPASEAARLEALRADPLAVRTAFPDLSSVNIPEILQLLKIPCLLVYGQLDPVLTAPASEVLFALPEHVHTILLDQSGHFPMLEETNRYNRLLSDFLSLPSGESPRQLQLKEEWKRRIR